MVIEFLLGMIVSVFLDCFTFMLWSAPFLHDDGRRFKELPPFWQGVLSGHIVWVLLVMIVIILGSIQIH